MASLKVINVASLKVCKMITVYVAHCKCHRDKLLAVEGNSDRDGGVSFNDLFMLLRFWYC